MPRRGPTIADTVLDLIRERGPMTLDGLVPPIVAAGRTRAKNPHNAVRTAIAYNSAFIESPDGRWHSLADQLEGAVFTVRLTSLERREEIVVVRDDLALVERLVPHAHLVSGEDAVHRDYLGDYFELPFLDEDDDVDIRARIDEETADALLGFLVELGMPPGNENDHLRELLWETRFTQLLHGPRPGGCPSSARASCSGSRSPAA